MASRKSTQRRRAAKANKPPAAVYYRMSTDAQDTSIDNQDREVRKLADRDYEVVSTYSDPGRSASKRKVKRSEFQRMLFDAAEGKFRAIVCYDLSRFTRLDSLDAAADLTRLRDAGVVIHTVAEGVLDMGKEHDRMRLMIIIEHANSEARSIARRSLDGRANKVRRGGAAGSKTPYGLAREVTDEKGKVSIYARRDPWNPGRKTEWRFVPGDKDEVKVVRWVYREYSKRDVSFRGLADELNVKGIPSPDDGAWGPAAIRRMLSNPKYVGDDFIGHTANGAHCRLENGERVESERNAKGTTHRKGIIVAKGIHKGIIKRELWNMVQRKNKRRRDTHDRSHSDGNYPLSGILVCGNCGKGMVAHNKGGGTGVRYICPSYSKYPALGCGAWSVAERDFVPFIIKALREEIDIAKLRSEGAKQQDDQPDALAHLISKRERLGEEKDKLADRIGKVSDSVFATVAAKIEKVQAEIDRTDAEIVDASGVTQSDAFRRAIEGYMSMFDRILSVALHGDDRSYLIDTSKKKWADGVKVAKSKARADKRRMVKIDKLAAQGRDDEVWKLHEEQAQEGALVYLAKAQEAAVTSLSGQELREALKAVDAKVTLWWKPRPEGQRRWELDRGRMTAVLGGNAISNAQVSTSNRVLSGTSRPRTG